MSTEHSPLPWRVQLGPDGLVDHIVGRLDPTMTAQGFPEDAARERIVETDGGHYPPDLATAAFIVRACNAHDALVRVADDADDAWHIIHDALKLVPQTHAAQHACAVEVLNDLQDAARAALAKAKGE